VSQFKKAVPLVILVAVLLTQAAQCRGPVPSFLIDQSAPTVNFVGLHQYSRTLNQLPLVVRTTDDVGVSRVELYIDRVLFATSNIVPNLPIALVSFNWTTVQNGKHVLQAKAYDAAGNSQMSTLVVLSQNVVPPTGNNISLIPIIRYQTMRGWEATDQAGQLATPAWNNYKDALFDQAVNDLGLNRVRLEVPSGIENPTDYFSQMIAGEISYGVYNSKRYEIINDNSDPNNINPNGFKWASLDHSIDNIVLPMRQRLQARGESLWINANYVDFGSSTFEHKDSPNEYAEFVLAAYLHMQSRYGFVPDSWEVILEPDTGTANWSAVQVAQAIKAAGDLLRANNFTPNFVAPSTTDAGRTASFIDQIALTLGAMQYVGEFSYHRYSGGTPADLLNISTRAVLYNKQTAMLEWIGADYNTLHQDIKQGRNSSWQQYTLAFPNEPDNGAQYYLVNDSNPNNPILTIGSRTKFLRQYFRYIRAGAQRIEALSGNANFDPLAFINTNGKYVVVVKAGSGGSFSVQDLPAGTYGIKYTTASQYNVDLSDVAINAGQNLVANIPGAGVITIFAR
jgi:hypothetical protein